MSHCVDIDHSVVGSHTELFFVYVISRMHQQSPQLDHTPIVKAEVGLSSEENVFENDKHSFDHEDRL